MNRAIRAARRTARNSPLPEHVRLRTLRALGQELREEQTLRRRQEVGRSSFRWWTAAAAAAVVVALSGSLGYLLIEDDPRAVVAEAKRQLFESSAVRFKAEFADPEETLKLACRVTCRNGDGLVRQETIGGRVSVIDYSRQTGISLLPQRREFSQVRFDTRAETSDELHRNILSELRVLWEGDHESLSPRKINGREVVGFRTRSDGKTMEVWIDRETSAPVRIVLESKLTGRCVLTEFQFDPEIDEGAFSLSAPADYAQLPPGAIDLREASHRDLARGLGFLARLNGGTFPDQPNVSTDLLGGAITGEYSSADLAKMGVTFARMTVFLAALPEHCSHWGYVGSGVKLGQADMPVIWWQECGSGVRRVIYGDLQVRDVPLHSL